MASAVTIGVRPVTGMSLLHFELFNTGEASLFCPEAITVISARTTASNATGSDSTAQHMVGLVSQDKITVSAHNSIRDIIALEARLKKKIIEIVSLEPTVLILRIIKPEDWGVVLPSCIEAIRLHAYPDAHALLFPHSNERAAWNKKLGKIIAGLP